MTGEDELIDWLRRRTAHRGGRLIGDDAAILPTSEQWAVTMDSQIAGVHFFRGLDPAIVARRLLAVNLSDIAAMGARPSYAFLALSAPPGFDHKRFLSALAEACERHAVDLAGGDLSRQPQVAAVLTLLGHRPKGQRWLKRDSARIGEHVWLGGTLGEAAAGQNLLQLGATLEARAVHLPDDLEMSTAVREAAKRAVRRQLSPRSQLDLGSWLGSRSAGAAIDVSDGLARDLNRLCSQSKVGAEIELERLPLPSHLHELARTIDRDWRDLALCGGEDYVLLFTLPAGSAPPSHFGCTRIGVISRRGVVISEQGAKRPLAPSGWDHLGDQA